MELVPVSLVLSVHQSLPKKDSLIRKSPPSTFHVLILKLYRSALQGKAGTKWTEGNLDKWLKSPADYAPGMPLFCMMMIL